MTCSLKNEKPSAIFRIKGLTQQNANTIGTNTAAIGISIESSDGVDAQLASLKGKAVEGSGGEGGVVGVGADMDGMQVENAGSLALVKPNSAIDAAAHANMAVALAPRIGE